MATKTNNSCYINRCLLFLGFFCEVCGFLDIDELKSIHYGIDIVSEPVVIGQEETSGLNSLQLVSKFGQQYQCSFPDHVQKDKQKEEKEKVAMETGIPELLKGLEDGPCLYKTKEWWTYEFCYGKHIRQYHSEDGKITGDVVYLGFFESEFDWNNETNQQIQAKVNKQLNRYHSQQYINGTKCDPTQGLRKSEVRFLCQEGAGDFISRIDEPETCSYIVTVHTTRICHHPYLKPPIQSEVVLIRCNPILSQAQYDLYLEEQKEKSKEEFIKRREELKERANKILKEIEETDKQDASDTDNDFDSDATDADESSHSESMNDNVNRANVPAGNTKSKIEKIQESVSRHVKELVKEGEGEYVFGCLVSKCVAEGDPTDMKMYVSVISDVEDLEKFIKEAVKLSAEEADKKAKVSKKDENNSEGAPNDGLTTRQADKKGVDKDSEEEKEPAVEDDDDDNDDNDDEDGNDDEDEEIIDEFSDDITKIKERLVDNREKFAEMKDDIRGTMHNHFDEILNEAERELAEEGVDVDDVDKKEAFDQLTGTLNKLIKRLEKTEEEIDKVDMELEEFTQKNDIEVKNKDINDDTDTVGAGDHTETDNTRMRDTEAAKGPDKQLAADDRLKVRVTKVRSGSDIQGLKEGTRSEQTKEIERSVNEDLEKAGIDTGGGTIQVKIITAGYYDGNDNSMEVLSSEDTAAFKNMIVAILSGDNEAGEEAKRYEQMENNYNFVFGENKQKSKDES